MTATWQIQGAGRVITERQANKADDAKVAQQLQEPARQLTVQQTLLKVNQELTSLA